MHRWFLSWKPPYLYNNFNPPRRQSISQTKCNAGTQILARKLVLNHASKRFHTSPSGKFQIPLVKYRAVSFIQNHSSS